MSEFRKQVSVQVRFLWKLTQSLINRKEAQGRPNITIICAALPGTCGLTLPREPPGWTEEEETCAQ